MHHKKLYLLLISLIILISILLAIEIKKTSKITIKKDKTPIISSSAINVPTYKEDPIYGNPGSAITIIEFTDFNCKRCKTIHEQLISFVDKNPQKARLIWKPLPKQTFFSAQNPLPHQAALCANKQNKFWQFVKTAMSDKKNITQAGLKKTAEGLNLDINKWTTCLDSVETKQIVSSSTLIAKQIGFSTALPTVFINNHWINTQKDINIKEILTQFARE